MFWTKVLLLSVLAVMAFPASSYSSETWRIASLDWQPYSDSAAPAQGNSIEKLRKLLEKENITLIVDFLPWSRAKEIAKKEEYIGYFPSWPEEVNEGFSGSQAVDWSEIGVMKQTATALDFKDIDALFKKYRVGLVRTYVYPEDIRAAAKKYPENTECAPDEDSLLSKLSYGRTEAAITDPHVMMYLVKMKGVKNVELDRTLTKKKLVLAFRNDPSNMKRLERLNKLLKDNQ